jgi:hypothetical protein
VSARLPIVAKRALKARRRLREERRREARAAGYVVMFFRGNTPCIVRGSVYFGSVVEDFR